MSLEIQMEAVIVRTWRTESCDIRDTLGGCDRASLEMHLEAMTERDCRSSLRRSMWRR